MSESRAEAVGMDHEGGADAPNQQLEPMLPASGSTACTDRGGRGCPCAFHARRRVYQREYAAYRRAKTLDAKRMSARTCPRRFGRMGVCGAVLRSDVIGGRVVVTCDACERFAKGLCRDCPRPVAGTPRKARFCATHRATADTAALARYYVRNHDDVLARARRSYRTNDDVRNRRNEYKRAWRKANREKVRDHKREYAERHPDRVAAYHVEYRKAHKAKRARRERDRYRDALPLRTCITPRCSIVLTGKKKKCRRCKERETETAAIALDARRGRGRRTDRERAA